MTAIAPAETSTRPDLERGVLEITAALVVELGTAPARGVQLDDVLDRDLGIGSLERVELVLRLEQAFGVRLGDAVMAEAERCSDVVEAIIAARPPPAEPLLAAPGIGPALAAPATARTLVDVLRWHAERTPDRVHIVLRRDDGTEQPITYGELWQRAVRDAAGLRARGVSPGDNVALMLRTESAFFSVFFAILLAGAVPVPIYPPFRPGRIEEYLRRQVGILANADARMLVTFREASQAARAVRRRVPTIATVVAADELAAGGTALPASGAASPTALIQYTSGSTGDPKGVVLTHANLLANIRAIGRALDVRPDDVCVSWLPLYHDMGLIGAWLGSLYHGIPVVLLSPLTFLARPSRWLTTLHRHGGTLSPAPNFAFDLCVKRIADDELASLDLSRWRLALNGSEPVSVHTIERFARRFAAYGLRASAMCPVYGLAEAAVGLTMTPPERGPRIDAVAREAFERRRVAEPAAPTEATPARFVSCGRPLPDHEIRIVDADGRPVSERVEGRIEFRGPSVTAGYFRKPDLTRTVMHGGWMDSGDLGYCADGELFVTGRVKDLIKKAGRNLYPQEIEDVVGGVAGIRRGCVAAFGVADPAIGTERLIVIAETRATDREARERLRAAVVEGVVATLGLPPDVVEITGPGAVLKTSSGKVRRSATRAAYLAGALVPGAGDASRWQRLRLLTEEARLVLARAGAGLAATAFLLRVGVTLLVMLPPLWVAVHALSGQRLDAAVRRWCRLILALAGCPLSVEGLANLPRGAAVFVANHASYLDVVTLLAALPMDFRFVAKRELLVSPLVGAFVRKLGHLTVDRVDLSRSVSDAARATALLRAGTPLLFFPEGTFLRTRGLLPFRLGAFKAAVEAGCPIVPIGIRGTRDVLPADTSRPRRGALRVTVGTPLQPADVGWREMVRLRDLARSEITRAANESA
jgi:1-acyl-sn-glycerol-3-phosphate acyltransferase